MSITMIAIAKQHLRVDGDEDDAMIQAYMDASEESAANFLNRALFADDTALASGIASAPVSLASSLAAIETRKDAAVLVDDGTLRCETYASIEADRCRCLWAYRATVAGMVITPMITAACLLILGRLYMAREDVVIGQAVADLPQGSIALLWPYRVGLGV